MLLRKDLSGVVISPEYPSIVLSAYADDVSVRVKDDKDTAALIKCLDSFRLASSLKCNWEKSKALWVPSVKNNLSGMAPAPPVHLPAKLKWVDDGIQYLGVFLGSTQYVKKKNWDGVVERVKRRLSRWRRALPHLSYKGRVLVINNLVASSLWHRFVCLQPPEDLLKEVQRQLSDFFWGGHHWLRPNVVCQPLAEGGQGMVDIKSRIMAFRLCSVQRLMSDEQLPSHLLAAQILRQAGGLGYGVNAS